MCRWKTFVRSVIFTNLKISKNLGHDDGRRAAVTAFTRYVVRNMAPGPPIRLLPVVVFVHSGNVNEMTCERDRGTTIGGYWTERRPVPSEFQLNIIILLFAPVSPVIDKGKNLSEKKKKTAVGLGRIWIGGGGGSRVGYALPAPARRRRRHRVHV